MVTFDNFRQLKGSDFAKNVSTLMTGSVVSQIIPFLVAPIISRMYSPEDYAILAAYNSITVLLSIVATGMYSSALMLDKSNAEALNTAAVGFLITVGISALTLFFILFFKDAIVRLSGNDRIELWLYFIPITVFLSGGYQLLNMWNNRLKRYKRLGITRVLQTFITSGTTLLFGILNYHSSGLFLSMFLGQVFTFSILLIQTFSNDKDLMQAISLKNIKVSFVKHRDFPKYNMPQGFMDGFRESSIVIIISNYFGDNILGSYSFAMSMLNKPFQFIGDSFQQVYFQKISENRVNNKRNMDFHKKIILLLSFFAIMYISIFAVWGESLFVYVFGDRWGTAGELALILSPLISFRFVSSAISSTFVVYNKQRQVFWISLLVNILVPFCLLIGSIYDNSSYLAWILFSFVYSSSFIIGIIWNYSITLKAYNSET